MKKIFTKISLLFAGLMLCAGNAWAEPQAIGETGLYWDIVDLEGEAGELDCSQREMLIGLYVGIYGSYEAAVEAMPEIANPEFGCFAAAPLVIGSKLVITGTGALPDYDNEENKAPWSEDSRIWHTYSLGEYYAYQGLELPDGLTSIGNYAFRQLEGVGFENAVVVIPSSVRHISSSAFLPNSITLKFQLADDDRVNDVLPDLKKCSSEFAEGYKTYIDITLNRPAQKEYYNTICLPFALDADQIAASNLADAEIYKFSNAAKDDDYLDLHFQPVTTMEAGVPYFFRFPTSGDNLSSLTFENVTVTTTTPQDVTHNGVTLHGTLSQVTINGSGKLYLAAGNNLKYYDGDKTINPFRAYFEVAGGMSLAPKARIVAHENAATGVEDVAAESKAVKFVENGQILIKRGEAVYNLQGQVVK